jgi:hypothetical protein
MKLILRSENSLGAMEEYHMYCILFGGVEFFSFSNTHNQRRRRRRQSQSSPISSAAAQQQQGDPKLLMKYPPLQHHKKKWVIGRIVIIISPTTTSDSGTTSSSSSSGDNFVMREREKEKRTTLCRTEISLFSMLLLMQRNHFVTNHRTAPFCLTDIDTKGVMIQCIDRYPTHFRIVYDFL